MREQNLKGNCWVLHAFDIGDFITLSQCRALLGESNTQQSARTRRAPSDFGLDPQPIIWEAENTHLILLGKSTPVRRQVVIYDFGVISVSLAFAVGGPLSTWRDLAHELYEYEEFFDVARKTAEVLAEKIKEATDDPRFARIFESYFVFQTDPDPGLNLDHWFEKNKLLLTQILRGEKVDLSMDETEEALSRRITYETNDLVIIDWNTAIIMDRNYDDALAVLELANAQLLEMRMLDDRLDDMLEEAYRTIRIRSSAWRSIFRPYSAPVRRLAELMADAAAEFEAVNNAIKLTNDQYLARVYRIAAKRFQLTAFDADISRKLDTLWEIYGVFTERAANRRLEILEWIVIILIFFELLHSLL